VDWSDHPTAPVYSLAPHSGLGLGACAVEDRQLMGDLEEIGDHEQIFVQPEGERMRAYGTGRFG
jgi:hypothetical protein